MTKPDLRPKILWIRQGTSELLHWPNKAERLQMSVIPPTQPYSGPSTEVACPYNPTEPPSCEYQKKRPTVTFSALSMASTVNRCRMHSSIFGMMLRTAVMMLSRQRSRTIIAEADLLQTLRVVTLQSACDQLLILSPLIVSSVGQLYLAHNLCVPSSIRPSWLSPEIDGPASVPTSASTRMTLA